MVITPSVTSRHRPDMTWNVWKGDIKLNTTTTKSAQCWGIFTVNNFSTFESYPLCPIWDLHHSNQQIKIKPLKVIGKLLNNFEPNYRFTPQPRMQSIESNQILQIDSCIFALCTIYLGFKDWFTQCKNNLTGQDILSMWLQCGISVRPFYKEWKVYGVVF